MGVRKLPLNPIVYDQAQKDEVHPVIDTDKHVTLLELQHREQLCSQKGEQDLRSV